MISYGETQQAIILRAYLGPLIDFPVEAGLMVARGLFGRLKVTRMPETGLSRLFLLCYFIYTFHMSRPLTNPTALCTLKRGKEKTRTDPI